MIDVRAEMPSDHRSVHDVNRLAFESEGEARLVEAVRGTPRTISLIATIGTAVVGHILFSPVEIEGGSSIAAVGLGPMAVLPEHQRRGVGTSLVRRGLEECGKLAYELVVVVGHPTYYPRFGFVRASALGLRCEFEAPDDAFLALPLRSAVPSRIEGLVRYLPQFREIG
jgi:putative acetyltransferase